MGPILILDSDPIERRFIAALADGQYDPILEACDSTEAGEVLLGQKERSAMIVAVLNPKDDEAIILLCWMHRSDSTIPVVMLAKGAARQLEPKARALGVRVFVHDPSNAREIQTAMQEASR